MGARIVSDAGCYLRGGDHPNLMKMWNEGSLFLMDMKLSWMGRWMAEVAIAPLKMQISGHFSIGEPVSAAKIIFRIHNLKAAPPQRSSWSPLQGPSKARRPPAYRLHAEHHSTTSWETLRTWSQYQINYLLPLFNLRKADMRNC